MSEAEAQTPDLIREIPLDLLEPSPFNPRVTLGDVSTLAESIRQEGRIHQPLLVRPVLANELRPFEPPAGYEVVFGHRRLSAARQLGLATVPCMVRDMTGAEARSAQIAENLQREDVHPFEEAEAFQYMLKQDGLNADALAERIGKSRSYVYGRLKLLQAEPTVRQACIEGKVGAEVALLLARLRTPELQRRALNAIKGKGLSLEDGGQASFRRIRALLVDDFTADLTSAIFDGEDPTLADAGPCSICPKRSGNAPEYQDLADAGKDGEDRRGWFRLQGPNVCTDPVCFAAKKTEHLKRAAAALESSGKTVLAGAKAKAALSAYGGLKPGYQQVKGKPPAGAQVLHVQDPKTGKVIQAIKLPEAPAAPSSGRSSRQDDTQAREKWEARQKARSDRLERFRRALMLRVNGSERTRDDLALIVETLIDLLQYQDYYDTHGWEPLALGKADLLQAGLIDESAPLGEVLGKLSGNDLGTLAINLCLAHQLGDSRWDSAQAANNKLEPTLAAMADRYGVDPADFFPTPSVAAAGQEENAEAEPELVGDPDEHDPSDPRRGLSPLNFVGLLSTIGMGIQAPDPEDRPRAIECWRCPECHDVYDDEFEAEECCQGEADDDDRPACPCCARTCADHREASDCCLWKDLDTITRWRMADAVQAGSTWAEQLGIEQALIGHREGVLQPLPESIGSSGR